MYNTLFEKIMEERGLSYNVISIKTGISKAALWNYAKGTRVPDLDNAILILKGLNLSINYIEFLFKPAA